MELEIVIIIMSLVGGLGFCFGSWISPMNKQLKSQIRFLEGKVNKWKQDQKADKTTDWIDQLCDDIPIAKPFKSQIKQFASDPKMIQGLIEKFTKNDNSGNAMTWGK